jgi:hypothetical protein
MAAGQMSNKTEGRFMRKIILLLLALFLWPHLSHANIDLVTLPTRDRVQLTIYNSADLTLAKETRFLTLTEGFNQLQFSWANTLIDPTSLDIIAAAQNDKIDVQSLQYPPRTQNVGVWSIASHINGPVPVEISYLTSGLSWRAFYLGTLTADEKHLRLKGYVLVANKSGEDYADAQVRLVVGKVHLIDQIAALARRQAPYGAPYQVKSDKSAETLLRNGRLGEDDYNDLTTSVATKEFSRQAKTILKEGLSEYFLYTIEGRETIPDGWSKRLPSFDVGRVPVVNLYKYEEERYGAQVMRFLSFKNDEEHELGATPIPGGTLKVFRQVDAERHLSYAGQSSFKYIPVDEDVELNLGAVRNIIVEPKLMDFKTENYMFDRYGNISGWDEVRSYRLSVKNTRDLPVQVEIKRNFTQPKWEVVPDGDFGQFEAIDTNTIKFTLNMQSQENKEFMYFLRTFHGRRGDHR